MKKALITGIYGQDGFYMTKLLLTKGYKVYGFVKKLEAHIDDLVLYTDKNVTVYECSIDNYTETQKYFAQIQPDECYHFAATSFVSFDYHNSISVMNTNFSSTQYLLSSIENCAPDCKFYFAGSSEMFGNPITSPQTEDSPFNPRTIYGISKLAGYHLVKNYRTYQNVYACTGIAYNHESPRRSTEFVTRKITSSVAQIYLGLQKKLYLGNIDANRDWGYAPEYVQAMWMMLNNSNEPTDYIIATGRTHSVRYFLETAFAVVNLDYNDFIETKKDLIRPTEKIPLVGNPIKIKNNLGWEAKSSLKSIITEMVLNDIDILKRKESIHEDFIYNANP